MSQTYAGPMEIEPQMVDEKNDTTVVVKEDVTHMTAEDRATALKLAIEADPGIPPVSLRYFKFVLMMLAICLCGGDSGFDGTLLSSINSMTQFQSFFGLGKSAPSTGIVFGMFNIGAVFAAFPASFLPDRLGRRYTMFIGNGFLIVGALITGFAQNFDMLIWGRLVTGFGCTIASSAASSYMSEITSPATRGRWLGLLNSFYYVGQITASGIAIPLGRDKSNWSWRTPMLVQIAPAAINAAVILFMPESPRWLFAHGFPEKAAKVLAKLHSRDNDVNSPLVRLEMGEFAENISLTGADKRFYDFREIFRTRAYATRFGHTIIVACFSTWAGNGLITYFLPTLLKMAGITSPDRQRVLNFVNSVTSFAGALFGTFISDFVGRRPLMLFAECSCATGMALVAALLSPSGTQNNTRATAGISFIYLFMVFYSVGWTGNQAIYPAEVLPYEIRAKALALKGWCNTAFSCVNTFGLPVALAKLGWKTYLIFMCWDLVGIVVVYLFVVETKRLSLEDLDYVFESRNPKRTSLAIREAANMRARESAGIGA